jgi:hypothetical protein
MRLFLVLLKYIEGMRSCIALFLIVFVTAVYGQEKKEAGFVPPLKIKPVVSGTFGEVRPNHFHSGLDLATNGKTGYRVYSSDDGFVARIKVSPVGYGKAVYIQHPNGYTTVYGHLQRYSKRIDSLVRHRQYENKSYAIELFFKKDELPVKKGEVIAYTGNTGSSGGPHLHYEIRKTASQKPMDPLLFRDDVADDVKPKILGLKIYPLDSGSRVEGKDRSKYLQTVYYDKQYHPKGQRIVRASGEIGLGIQVLDYYTGSWRKCGVRSIELLVDSERVFKSDVSIFSFAETRYVNSLMDYAEKMHSGKVIQKSFVEPNNKLSIYKELKNKGVIELKPGEVYDVKYIVKDAAGNESVMTFKLKGVEYPAGQPASAVDEGVQMISWDKPFHFEASGAEVDIISRSLYKDEPFYFEVDNDPKNFLSPVYVIGKDDVPVQKYFTVSINVPDSVTIPKEKLLVAGVTSKGKPYSIGGKYEDGKVTVRTRDFGKFTLFYDTIPPVVRLYRAPASLNYKGRRAIGIKIYDNMSGVKDYDCYIDGKWVLFEYDAKTYRLTGYKEYFPEFKPGKHELKVVVTDDRGNKTEKKYNITL